MICFPFLANKMAELALKEKEMALLKLAEIDGLIFLERNKILIDFS